MSNLRVIHDNATSRATLTSSTQAGSLGPNNLKIEDKSSIFRSTGTSVTITATLPLGEIVGGVIFPFCNLTSNAKIRVRGYTAPGDSVPVVDTGEILACAYAPLGDWEWGAAALGVNAFSYGGGTYARAWIELNTMRYLVIDFSDPDNPAGYLEFARLVFGNYWAPAKNADYGASVTPMDTSTQYRTEAGVQQVEAGVLYRKLNVSLSQMSPLDRASFWRLVRGSGKRRPILLSVFPDSDDPELEQSHQVYGRLSDLAAITSPYFQTYASTLDIEEL